MSGYRKMLIWMGFVCSLVLLREIRTAGEEVLEELSPDDVISAAFHRPLLEILHPENGQVLENSELQIRIACDEYVLPSRFRDAKVCVAMSTNKDSRQGIKATVMQKCFLQTESTVFTAAGLLPGAYYMLRVLLIDRGHVVAVSVRSFRVAAIAIHDKTVTIRTALEEALAHHQRQEREAAAVIYSRILAENPLQQDALHLMGLVLYQNGSPQDAIPYIERAISGNSSFLEFHNSLGLCFRAVGKLRDAVSQFELALSINPNSLEATFNLGLSWQQLSEWERATVQYSKVISATDSLYKNGSLSQKYQGIASESQIRLCDLLQGLDKWEEALQCLNAALRRWPENKQLLNERGTVALRLGYFERALRDFQDATKRGFTQAEFNVAIIEEVIGETKPSRRHFKNVLSRAQENGSPSGHILIMNATVLPRIQPDTASAVVEARDIFEQNLDNLIPIMSEHADHTEPLSVAFSLGFYLSAHPQSNRNMKQKLARVYNLYCPPLITGDFLDEENAASHDEAVVEQRNGKDQRSRVQSQRIRVGFVSRFFYHNAIGLLLLEMIQKIDKTKFEVFIFTIDPRQSDFVAQQLAKSVEHYVVLHDSLRNNYQEVRRHKLNVLVYPELGTDPTSYFMAFGRLAPVQAVWWGHPDTSGIPAMDVVLTTKFEHEDAASHYTEQMFQMKGMGIYFSRPKLPAYAETPDTIREYLAKKFLIPKIFHMFICTESLIHIHPDFDRALKTILQRDKLGHVFFLGHTVHKFWTQRISQRFERNLEKVAHRIHFLIDMKDDEIAAYVNAADVALDPFYCSGPFLAYHAFSVGTPVVTMEGIQWRSRIVSSVYRHMEVLDMIAPSISDYVHIALRLVHDHKYRSRMSAKILENAPKLYEDDTAVQEWERFFVEVTLEYQRIQEKFVKYKRELKEIDSTATS